MYPTLLTDIRFITQEAKLRLEKAGAIIYKDASANKGGVTSSSLEGSRRPFISTNSSACLSFVQRCRVHGTHVCQKRRCTRLL